MDISYVVDTTVFIILISPTLCDQYRTDSEAPVVPKRPCEIIGYYDGPNGSLFISILLHNSEF